MKDNRMQEYKFNSVYKFVDIISEMVESECDFWNFDDEMFVQSALKFNKISLLHIYVVSTLYSYYSRDFRKFGDCVEDEDVSWWIDLMKVYDVKLTKRGYCNREGDCDAWNWFKKNEKKFFKFFDAISDEIVHILYNDKHFLVKFNRLVRHVVKDEDGFYSKIVSWPIGARNDDGTIKRCTIPQWVKQAVFYRDKGRCVFCNKDLTGLVNTLNNKNFDHIIPLHDYGTNDPCNIQLTCEECNKSKGDKDIEAKYMYQTWW